MRKKKIIKRIDQTLNFYQATLNSNIKSVKTEVVIIDLQNLKNDIKGGKKWVKEWQ